MIRSLTVLTLALAVFTGVASAAEYCDKESNQAWLGVYLGPAGEDGVAILGVVGEDAPAAKVGLQNGDVITRLDGRTVTDVAELVQSIQGFAPGQEVNIDIIRDDKQMSFTVELGTRPNHVRLFELQGDQDHPIMKFRASGGPAALELHQMLKGMHPEGAVQISVTCEEGKGTLTIEQDGKEQVQEFDCEGTWENNSATFNWQGSGERGPLAKVLELNKGGNMQFSGPGPGGVGFFSTARKASTRINVADDGQITVTVNKGDAEMSLQFRDADDLAERNPGLYEKYQELLEGLE